MRLKRTGVMCLLFSLCFLAGQAQQAADYQQRIRAINANINQIFYDEQTGLYMETNGKNEKPHAYLWPLCALMQAENEAEATLLKKELLKPVLDAIAKYKNNDAPAPGYQAYVTKEQKDSRFYDDNQWIAIAALDAYERTKNPSYLKLAEEIYTFMMTGYDKKTGGGLYWKEDEKNTKNTCSNGPGILVALQLYKLNKKPEYLNTALDLYAWTNKHLRSPDGTYWDAIKIPSMKIDSAKYTYNTGTMLQSNVLLYEITKEDKYLKEANQIAGAARDFFYVNNKLPGNYWFNVVLLRGYEALYKVNKDKSIFSFFVDDAERIWKEERDENNLMGRKPEKTLIDQSAMVEMYARLARLTKE
ncbi:glycoside hydrolase family 76 protein [Dyadobacter sp. CY343]|uniref:glycoside hydrolase family 76 protein n=1 Tax=Dyadobacter sp. CY343 TaxID=2907299 RepID=UPI001F258260|nr:glycoside hydrolase family 76 protein [Dyadobacter sp. CY343]MCE7061031.1 glycoside hydrolase family 76 protein [Dyadobacter sp. CY343]